MPKDKRVTRSSFEQTMASPYAGSMKVSDGNNSSNSWEEVRCPICMEHPHNAVELKCSSRDNGCQPFMCDTSYRHSNCLDLFRKSSSSARKDVLVCPLCRGTVTGWNIMPEARKFMNSKTRTCSLETCDFGGNYAELRKHARLEHPTNRPSVASPTRESNWVALEQERDLEDTFTHQFTDYFDTDDYPMSTDFSSDSGSFDWSGDGSLTDFLSVSSGSFDFDDDDIMEDMFSYTSISRPGYRGESASSGLRAGATYPARRESNGRTFPRLRSSDTRDVANTSSSARSINHRENVPASSRSRSSDRRGNRDLVPMGFSTVENSSNSISGNLMESASSGLRARATYRARRESSMRPFPSLRSRDMRNYANTNLSASSRNYRENVPANSRSRSSDRRENGEPSRVMRLRSDGSEFALL